jgi:hypothetical protein
VLKRQNQAVALGFVTSRMLEAAIIVLLYRSGLVPGVIPVLGFIGTPLLTASATTALSRGNDPVRVAA